MCSFGVSSKPGLLSVNDYARLRGPDDTSFRSINNIDFIHNLLHITGSKTTQPFFNQDIACVYNGEIYNYKSFGNYNSDGECIIPLYKEYGSKFARLLDGEYAIVLIDFKQNKIITSTDCFGTKPLWYAFEREFAITSFKSQLERLGFNNFKRQQYNTTNVFDLTNYKLLESTENYSFDLNQYKTSFEDWNIAFKDSIKKRVTAKNMFIGLSSGFDSGLLALEMTNQKVDFLSLSIFEGENKEILSERIGLIDKNKKIIIDNNLLQEFKKLENDEYDFKSDKAAFGIFNAFKMAREYGKNVLISGHGADEIICDYGFNGKKIYEQSTFGGYFPEDLTSVFPWNNFFEGTQQIYLSKEESIASYFGIESRYPFLDVALVQEFLWLKPELKNTNYKGCIQSYLKTYNYPYSLEKIGWPGEACSLV